MIPPLVPIERGIPIPPQPPSTRQHPPKRWMYPWLTMDVMDSFFVASEGRNEILLRKDIMCILRRHKRLGMRRFEVRRVEGGVRVWRVE